MKKDFINNLCKQYSSTYLIPQNSKLKSTTIIITKPNNQLQMKTLCLIPQNRTQSKESQHFMKSSRETLTTNHPEMVAIIQCIRLSPELMTRRGPITMNMMTKKTWMILKTVGMSIEEET